MLILIETMNFHQFKYLLTLAETRHFERAADKCFVTQSTLSGMIAKFEDEIGMMVFDRSKKPVEVTKEGHLILERLKRILNEVEGMKEMVKELKGEVSGKLTMAVIPTIAPFLLPLFLQKFAENFPLLHITIKEQTTGEIIKALKNRELDLGILSIPVADQELVEYHLYDEPFLFFDAAEQHARRVRVEEVAASNLCLLEEGHCMRTQVLSLCDFKEGKVTTGLGFDYKAGSIDSLLRFVKANHATTLLPQLATHQMTPKEKKHLASFKGVVPYRSVGILVHKHFVKKQVLNPLKTCIQNSTSKILPKIKGASNMLAPIEWD